MGSNGVPLPDQTMRYLEGFGLPAQQTVSTGATQYLHGDLIRSTMLTTGQGGTAVSAVSYTAFGQVIGTAPDTRYQYAGGWGYESGLLVLEGAPGTAPITLQHVGHRWYDPSIGRFIQRDPVGIFAGLNVYEYCHSNPLSRMDPLGLWYILDPELLRILDKMAAAAAAGAGGGLALGGLAGPVGAGTGAVALGIGAATGVGVYESLKYTCVSLWDIGKTWGQMEEQKRKNNRQRRDNPEDFPPPPRPWVDPPDPTPRTTARSGGGTPKVASALQDPDCTPPERWLPCLMQDRGRKLRP